MRENILNGKYFISFTAGANCVKFSGQILGEASDGWFYVVTVYTDGTTSKRVLPVAELESARFFDSETAMLDIRRGFEKPLIRPRE